jgi:RNA polymerase sigma-70 factor (ECF subfamily)
MTKIQFQQKILSIQRNMFSFAMTLTANRYDAEDLLQETTLRVLNNQDKYVDNVNFKGWVLTIMRNIFINNYRKELRSHIIVDQTDDLHHLNVAGSSKWDNPEETMTVKEIKFIINNLNDDLKIPFSMYLEGYKYMEISDKLALPLGTVKSRIFFARQELQRNLTGTHYYN